MNLRDLKYLAAVADKRHFGRAAEACHVSQPTLSAQIKKLEERLGVAIFERTNKSVTVTAIGEEILRHARRALEEAEQIEALANTRGDPMAGPLRLGVIPTLSPYLMPLLLQPLKKRYPKLRVVLSEEITERLLQRLREHSIDAALIATAVPDAELASLALFEEPFWLVLPRKHPLYNEDDISAAQLRELELLLLAEGHCLTDQVLDVCRKVGNATTREGADLRAASLETLLPLVGAGMGCTLVPALALRGAWMTDLGVVARSLNIPSARRRVSLVYRHSFPRTQALFALADVIVEHLPNTVKALYRSQAPGGSKRVTRARHRRRATG
jgi:LysR family hydrogen peroxide-inducible transcriptional activator